VTPGDSACRLASPARYRGCRGRQRWYGARFILLDDTETFKNWHNPRWLRADPGYRVIRADPYVRNGFAAFERAAIRDQR
jgi:hypothetical protein